MFAVAAIAASESRHVTAVGIGGAYLNADMSSGVIVYMRLDATMTELLTQISSDYENFTAADGTMVVRLDKALYGCVESALLWFNHLKATLIKDGFTQNPHDMCVFNKNGADGKQCTVVVHVDDLFMTCENLTTLESAVANIEATYIETRVQRGKVLGYLGMTFDFRTAGEARITMEGYVKDLLGECGVEGTAVTPAAEWLFDVRDTVKAGLNAADWFHRQVAKVLYLAKRVRPECLTCVAFLATRVTKCDIDDLEKLKRLLKYIRGTRDRGIVLRPGAKGMQVRQFVDAAYGVHSDGKSHTGSTITLGDAGPVCSKSSKQHIVTKSSTEAELVGLSDSANESFHMRNFIVAQGHESGPVTLYEDNLNCMALVKRGRSNSERTRHVSIRYFWVKERIDNGELVVEHLRTELMHANILTKPLQGSQFRAERRALTNWEE